ncbi:high mobility group box domain-containing protein, partial [Glomus cerebriforme]
RAPRPPNAFIIYRRRMRLQLREQQPLRFKESELSKEIGKLWNEESDEVKEFYHTLAEHAKQKHMRKYKGYKFNPRKKPK